MNSVFNSWRHIAFTFSHLTHFRNSHHMSIMAFGQLYASKYQSKNLLEKKVLDYVLKWMNELCTIYPYGLNERVKGVCDILTYNINVQSLSPKQKCRHRSHGHRRNSNLFQNETLDSVMSVYQKCRHRSHAHRRNSNLFFIFIILMRHWIVSCLCTRKMMLTVYTSLRMLPEPSAMKLFIIKKKFIHPTKWFMLPLMGNDLQPFHKCFCMRAMGLTVPKCV